MSRGYKSSNTSVASAAKRFAEWHRYRSDVRSAFGDMIHAWAISMLNAFSARNDDWAAREAEYNAIQARVGEEGIKVYAECLGAIMAASQANMGDHLGEMFQQISANSKAMGQFFTPYHVSEMMAMMAFDRASVEKSIAARGYVLAQEPACGAGGMVIAMGAALTALGFDPKQTLRVHAIDIDRIAVDMTFIQSTLQGIPCYVEQGNALTMPVQAELHSDAGKDAGYRMANVHYAAAVLREAA